MAMLWPVAVPAAAMMGFAIQRGATCLVAAVGDVVHRGDWTRGIALAEASLWVAALVLAARAAGLSMGLPPSFAPTLLTVAGGVLLGLGASLAGACTFGAIARLGSGEWSYAALPLGFFLGCLLMAPLLGATSPVRQTGEPLLLGASAWLALLVVALAAWRLSRHVRARGRARPRPALRHRIVHAWTPYSATLVIGVCFVVMLLAAGPWAYTEALSELSHGMTMAGGFRLLLFAALLAGAIAGGATAGRLRHRPPTLSGILRCLAGGALMGAGSLLVPGSNDGLILIGLPLLQPYAVLALAVMVATVFGCTRWSVARRRTSAM